MGCCCCRPKFEDPVPQLKKRPVIEVQITEPLIRSHSMRQAHQCCHKSQFSNSNQQQASSFSRHNSQLSPDERSCPLYQSLGTQFVAIHDFMPEEENDLQLREGDLFQLLKGMQNGWWIVRNLRTNEEGVAPSSYLQRIARRPPLRPWYRGPMSREDAERVLERITSNDANFLVRESSSKPGCLSISLRLDQDQCTNKDTIEIKHYLIHHENTNGIFCEMYFIHPDRVFPSLDDLISFYTTNALCCPMARQECPQSNHSIVRV